MRSKFKYLDYAMRQAIERMWADGSEEREIATAIGVHVSTVYRELSRGNTGNINAHQKTEYSADAAERRAREQAKLHGRRRITKKKNPRA